MTGNRRVSFLRVVLWFVNTGICVPSGKCSVSAHSTPFCLPCGKCCVSVYITHFWCTTWNVFCVCTQYTNFDVPSGKCSVSVHSTHFLCTLWKEFCFCAQYTFLMYRLESVLFLCTVHISDVQWYDISLRKCTNGNVFVLLVLLRCDFTVEETVPIPVETCTSSSIPYEFYRYQIFVLPPPRSRLKLLRSIEFRSEGQATWHTYWHLVNLSHLISRNLR